MELELDGEPKNRPLVPEDSPHATRWRVGSEQVVAILDVATGEITIHVGDRPIGKLPASGGSHRFTMSPDGGYRGGEQVEARVHRDGRTDVLTLWVGEIEVPALSRPPRPLLPRSPARPPAPSPERSSWSHPAILVAVVALVAVASYLTVSASRRRRTPRPSLEEQTLACYRHADDEAAAARKRLGDDPDIDDQWRLARIACQQRAIECRRDPNGLPCLMDAK